MTRPTALILDFGGVLTTDQWESVRACAVRLELPANTFVDLLRTDPVVALMFKQLERGDVTQATFEPVIAAAAGVSPAGLLADLCAGMRPVPRMLAAAGRLRAAGVRLGILSNSCGCGDFDPYAGYDLEGFADAVVISHVVGMRKPDREIYALAVDKLGVAAADCVFVDDTAPYVGPAEAIGMIGVRHVDVEPTVAELGRLFGVDRL